MRYIELSRAEEEVQSMKVSIALAKRQIPRSSVQVCYPTFTTRNFPLSGD
ncbi:MAG: hypothetical protein ACRC62_13895 [Microcoleus sp.]